MERKVARASGKRTLEEKQDLKKEIEIQKMKNAELMEKYKLLNSSIKKIDDDIRSLEVSITKIEEQKQKQKQIKKELRLENDMTMMDLNKIVKQKEE